MTDQYLIIPMNVLKSLIVDSLKIQSMECIENDDMIEAQNNFLSSRQVECFDELVTEKIIDIINHTATLDYKVVDRKHYNTLLHELKSTTDYSDIINNDSDSDSDMVTKG